jgi:hypothetical protein
MATKPVRKARTLAATMNKVTARAYRRRGFAAADVVNNWAAVVGEQLARHTVPERLTPEGTLRVRVAAPLATELQHMEPQILERIACYFGFRAATRLSLVRGPLPETTRPEVRRPRALDAAEEKTLTAALEGTRDPSLKTALEGLGRAVVARGSYRQPPLDE